MASGDAESALLIIIGEPMTDEQSGTIFQRILEGLSTWDCEKVNLGTELLNFVNKNVEAEFSETGGTILRRNGSRIYIEFLIKPSVQTLNSSLSSFLTNPATYKHILHAGPAFSITGSWILRDGTLSMHDFSRTLHRPDIATALIEITPNTALIVSCYPDGEWTDQGVKHHGLDKYGQISIGLLNGNTILDSNCTSTLERYLEPYLQFMSLGTLMPTSNIVGSIRFRRPTIYVFPSGQGDAALFGVDGFLMLLDGGFQRKTCFWDFLRHVDHLDAVLISRLNPSNVLGMVSFLDLLSTTGCAPKLAHIFGNIPEIGQKTSQNDLLTKNPLAISFADEGAKIFDRLSRLGLKSQTCAYVPAPVTAKYAESITLYEKVGQGRLEMYVLNPSKESKEYGEFVESWKKRAPKLTGLFKLTTKPESIDTTDYAIPSINRTSMAVLIVWRPSDQNERIVRVLYPGSTPQDKILNGLDKLKNLDFLKYPYCTSALLEKKPGGGLVGMKAALLTMGGKQSMGKTAAELLAEQMKLPPSMPSPPSLALKPLAPLAAPPARNGPTTGSRPKVPTTLTSPPLTSPPLDSCSDVEGGVNGGGMESPVEGNHHRAGFSVEAESEQACVYEELPIDRNRRNLEEMKIEWGEPLALPTLPPKKENAGASSKSTDNQSKPITKSNAAALAKVAAAKVAAKTNPPPSETNKGKGDGISTKSVKSLTLTLSPKNSPGSPVSNTKPMNRSTASAVTKTSPKAAATKTATPVKKQAATLTYAPCYVDLTYIPHQGNPYYCNVDFFKYIRSKYYVISSLNPSKETLDALLMGKKSWMAQDESLTIIPTYDSDTLALWMAVHKDEMALENVDVAPSCTRCSVNLEEHTGATCAAYRLEL